METLIHHSQVSDDMIRPGNLAKPIAVGMARLLGAEAYLCTDDQFWYAFDDCDEENEESQIQWLWLSLELYQKMRDFR